MRGDVGKRGRFCLNLHRMTLMIDILVNGGRKNGRKKITDTQ